MPAVVLALFELFIRGDSNRGQCYQRTLYSFFCYGKYCDNGKLLSLIKDRRVSDLHEANTSVM